MSKILHVLSLRQFLAAMHLQFKMAAMRTFFLFVFTCFYLSAFSQIRGDKIPDVSPDTTQELSFKMSEADTVFEIFNLQKAPVFPGGEKELMKFLAENLFLPDDCRDKTMTTGIIAVQFVIDTFGQAHNWKILKTPSVCFKPMMAEIFAKIPCWEPGELEGRRVWVRYVLPIRIHRE